jgi:hypothetical protein
MNARRILVIFLTAVFLLIGAGLATAGAKPLADGFPVRVANAPFANSPPLFFGHQFDPTMWLGTMAAASQGGTIAVLTLGRFAGEEAANNWEKVSFIPVQANGPLTLLQSSSDEFQLFYTLAFALGAAGQAQNRLGGGAGIQKATIWAGHSARYDPFFDTLGYYGLNTGSPNNTIVAADIAGIGSYQAVYTTGGVGTDSLFHAYDANTGNSISGLYPYNMGANQVTGNPVYDPILGQCSVGSYKVDIDHLNVSVYGPVGQDADYDGKVDTPPDPIGNYGYYMIGCDPSGERRHSFFSGHMLYSNNVGLGASFGVDETDLGGEVSDPPAVMGIEVFRYFAVLGDYALYIGQHNYSQESVSTLPETRADGRAAGAMSGPVLADIDGDGDIEALVSWGTEVAVFDHNGKIVTGPGGKDPDRYDTGAALTSSPIVADIDNDGLLEIAVAGSNTDGAGWFWAWQTTAPATSARPWPMAYRNPERNAFFAQ